MQSQPGTGQDGFLTLRAPDGRRAKLRLIARKSLLPRDVAQILAQPSGPGERLIIAPFLSPRTRELLGAAGESYVDETGNLRVVVRDPAIFLESQGADRDPKRQPRPLQSLRGAAAARVVRALCDFSPPYGVRTLADRSATPLGTVSRVVSFLEAEAVLHRDEKKQILVVDQPALIRRWVVDYSVTGSNVLRSYIEPRGIGELAAKLASIARYAVTGSMANPSSVAPARLAAVYVDDAADVAKTLELVPTDAGANVWLLEPFDAVVFERTRPVKLSSGPTIVAVAPSQLAADLMTSPGRGPQEAEALLVQMRRSERGGRKKS